VDTLLLLVPICGGLLKTAPRFPAVITVEPVNDFATRSDDNVTVPVEVVVAVGTAVGVAQLRPPVPPEDTTVST
jgi:hypothetical protein